MYCFVQLKTLQREVITLLAKIKAPEQLLNLQ